MQTKRNGTTTPTPLWAFGLVLALGLTVLGMERLAQAAHHWGPGVGDIVSFSQPRPVLAPDVSFSVTRLDAGGTATCTLSSKTMARSHGSLIVETVAPGVPDGYRAHWAGGPTAAGAQDCGPRADLVLSGSDLGSLASAAGGFGADHRSMLPLLSNPLQTRG